MPFSKGRQVSSLTPVPVCATKTLEVARERGCNDFVCMCFWIQTTRKLNWKLAKSMPIRCSIRAIYTREKYWSMNLGVKQEGGCLLEGGIFSRNYGTYMISVWYTWPINTPHLLNTKSRPRCYAKFSSLTPGLLPWLMYSVYKALFS